ncbi:RluA family pseudouridine synthase [Acholeplasma hippikon]|uniref:Pseudouridine synthase n=1 Tax=Acholeplasma hippikon TaxID=264636 RepID=A0A449BJ64_9MOLU|nr:RluA family pseudouridine synthase [Acholeplasma hippikon]VEU82505.1 pseudouridylate synthase [Acholeplasma hippikon]
MNKTLEVNLSENKRLDHYLVENLELTRTYITKLIKEGDILVNSLTVKPGYILKAGDIISVNIPEAKDLDLTPVDMKLDIVYEDDYLLVINKPKGLVVHPSNTYRDNTLVHGLLHELEDNLSDINGVNRPGILHRIDKDTTGLLMVAKTNEAHQILAKDLANHDIKRSYIALVTGAIQNKKGTINAPIGRDPKHRTKNAVVKDGKHAVTHFEVIKNYRKYALIECNLETGRTHQIRVHMEYIGHPIVGDPLYGIKPLPVDDGQMLHAYKLQFTHPITKKAMTFEVPLPEGFKKFLETLN